MKRVVMFLFAFLLGLTGMAQVNFSNGYQEGFKKGYCWEGKQQGNYGCLEPIVPISPLSDLSKGEVFDDYEDGYFRGFEDGKIKFRNENTKNRNANSYPIIHDYGEPIEAYDFDFMLKLLEFRVKYDTYKRRRIEAGSLAAQQTIIEKKRNYKELYEYYKNSEYYDPIEFKGVEFNIDIETDFDKKESWQIYTATPFLLQKDECFVLKKWTGGISDENINLLYQYDPSLRNNPSISSYLRKYKGVEYEGTAIYDENKEIVLFLMKTTENDNADFLRKRTKIKKKVKGDIVRAIKNCTGVYTNSKKERYLISLKRTGFKVKYEYVNIILDLEKYKNLLNCTEDNRSDFIKDIEFIYRLLKEN